MPFCPKCRYEYEPSVSICPDCGERLVSSLPEEPPKISEEKTVWPKTAEHWIVGKRLIHKKQRIKFSYKLCIEKKWISVERKPCKFQTVYNSW